FVTTFAARPAVYEAWKQLNGAIKASMDLRRYELATLAAARRLGSSYCTLAHGTVLADEHLPTEAVRTLVADLDVAELTDVEIAVIEFAEKVVADATSVVQADVERLRALGLRDVLVVGRPLSV
ncbi:MAG: carboxymuconolactone decarboxylase family protein, partial [Jiangellaceae bacterium]